MTQTGKIIYGGEAFEQNRDPSPGLGMGEIRYFFNEPSDPRWLKCDGNIYKRSSYPAYAELRPMPAIRFKQAFPLDIDVNSSIFYASSYKTDDNCYVYFKYIEDEGWYNLVKYSLETGNETIISSGIQDGFGHFFKFKEKLFFINRSNTDTMLFSTDNWDTYDSITLPIGNMFGILNPNHFIIRENFIAFPVNYGYQILWSVDGEEWNAESTYGLGDELEGSYAMINSRVFMVTDSGEPTTRSLALSFGDVDGNYYWYSAPGYNSYETGPNLSVSKINARPIDVPYISKFGPLNAFNDNTIRIPFTNSGYFQPQPRIIKSLADGEVRVLFVFDGIPVFVNHYYNVGQLGFLQNEDSSVEFFNLQDHPDMVKYFSNLLNAGYLEYYTENKDLIQIRIEDGDAETTCHVFRMYYGIDYNDAMIGIYTDETMFHAPGLQASKIDGSFPYVWTGE